MVKLLMIGLVGVYLYLTMATKLLLEQLGMMEMVRMQVMSVWLPEDGLG